MESLEVTCYGGDVTVERFYGYEHTDDSAAYVYEYTGSKPTGTTDPTGSATYAPGDTVGWVRWDTGRTNEKGRKVYLRKYFHGIPIVGSEAAGADTLAGAWTAAAATYGAAVLAGSGDWPGLADPQGNAPTGAVEVATYASIRQLRRRGPRPH